VANVHNLEKNIKKRTNSIIYLILWDFFFLICNVVGGMLTKRKNLHGILENKMPTLASI
jgi:hypothetical protein